MKKNDVLYLEAHFTCKGNREHVVRLAEPVVARVVLVHRVLGRDGQAGEHDHDHDELVKGGSAHEPVDHFAHTEIEIFDIKGVRER